MDFELDTEQAALRDAVRDLLNDTYGSIDDRRKAQEQEPGFDEKAWLRLAEMGVLGLAFDEEVGGMGAGPVEVGLVAHEMGRVLAPEPFVEAVVLAGGLVAAVGTPEQQAELLPGLAEGTTLLAFAHDEPGRRWGATASSVRAEETGEGWVVSGVKEPVVAGARADVLVVSAATDAGTQVFLVDGAAATRESYTTVDGSRAARVVLDRAPARPLGAPVDRTADIERALASAQIASCRELVGIMERALWMTVDYLKTRKQFGVPLSSFQALTFRAADMYIQLELATSMALWATLVQDAGGDVLGAASRAKAQVAAAARHIGQEAVQLHGGIGMTAEYPVGHYLARIVTLEHTYGDRAWHVARLAAKVGEHDMVDPFAAAVEPAKTD